MNDDAASACAGFVVAVAGDAAERGGLRAAVRNATTGALVFTAQLDALTIQFWVQV